MCAYGMSLSMRVCASVSMGRHQQFNRQRTARLLAVAADVFVNDTMNCRGMPMNGDAQPQLPHIINQFKAPKYIVAVDAVRSQGSYASHARSHVPVFWWFHSHTWHRLCKQLMVFAILGWGGIAIIHHAIIICLYHMNDAYLASNPTENIIFIRLMLSRIKFSYFAFLQLEFCIKENLEAKNTRDLFVWLMHICLFKYSPQKHIFKNWTTFFFCFWIQKQIPKVKLQPQHRWWCSPS